MSQPTLSTGFQLSGVTTLRWGTDGLLNSPAPGGSFAGTGYYIVESFDETAKVEQVYGENGTGVEVWRANLTHGKRWNITVQDDTQMTPPVVGNTVIVVDIIASATTTYTAVVLNNDYRAARKQPGHRVLLVENLTLVDSQTIGSA